jgi:Cu2+-exporting ATPase
MNMSVQQSQAPAPCFHCGLPVPPGTDYTTIIDGKHRAMCCPGCQAVAQAIVDGGLDNFYRHRDGQSADSNLIQHNRREQRRLELELYDTPELQRDFVHSVGDHQHEALLVIEGITCAACVWLLEKHIGSQEGVVSASVNLATHRARIRWRSDQVKLSLLMAEIDRLGYQAHPYQPNREEQLLEKERKQAVRRLGVAGVCTAQTMMLSTALYAGELSASMDGHIITLMHWASMVLATPVALYSSIPFYKAAWRDLQTRSLSMDVPVSLAILLAYFASVWATLAGKGDTYFESVTMFAFFLLVGRFLEMAARHRTGRAGNALLDLLPATATRLDGNVETLIPANQLRTGDIVLVKAGHTIPADGRIVEGRSSVDESALTGEYMPQSRATDDQVIGGTLNIEHPLQIEVTETGSNSRLSTIVRMLDRAHAEKPAVARMADKAASQFVLATLITAAAVAIFWYFYEPERAFWVTLSVLVVTCPCALSLATPTALTAATGSLRQRGILISRGHVLESLATASHIVFDKTGTLTEGNLNIEEVRSISGYSSQQLLHIAAALESRSEHPIARAFRAHVATAATEVEVHVGQGLSGRVEGQLYRIGRPDFACPDNTPAPPESKGLWLLLSDTTTPLGWFRLDDQIRAEAAEALQQLRALGLTPLMLTGDASDAAHKVAAELGIDQVFSGMSPEQKLSHLNQLGAAGAEIIMVGDGINDIPALAGARTSVAMASATDLAKTSADAVLIANDLLRLPESIRMARKTQRIIRENLSFSLFYNLLALPAAAAGLVPPYWAAIGMSASSLIVVGNAMRLSQRNSPVEAAKQETEN